MKPLQTLTLSIWLVAAAGCGVTYQADHSGPGEGDLDGPDSCGEPVSIEFWFGDQLETHLTLVYDADGRLVREDRVSPRFSDAVRSRYLEYDDQNRLVRKVDESQSRVFSYGADGRPTIETRTSADGTLQNRTEFAYRDGRVALVEKTGADGLVSVSTTYEHDANGRVVEAAVDGGGAEPPNGVPIDHTFDHGENGEVVTQTAATGTVVWTYDRPGTASVQVVNCLVRAEGTTHFCAVVDHPGRLLNRVTTDSSGTVHTSRYEYSAGGDLLRIKSDVQDTRFTYDCP